MTMTHETCMRRCLDLAGNGLGSAAPNPLVGAVVVYQDRIIGEGFHTGFGKAHAEVEAINQVMDQSLLSQSTLYVNLEPCNHQGKTPPCTDLILEKGIAKVVIGQWDPNPVAGGGVDRLRRMGVEVVTGILETECRWMNRRFNTFHLHGRPYIILKWAQTTDGFVDTLRDRPKDRKPAWITDETCRMLVHKWRAEEQAILAGSRTIILDNPQLNVRAWEGKDPVRLSIDRKGRLTEGDGRSTLRIMDGSIPSIIYTGMVQGNSHNLEFVQIESDEPVWPQVLADLHRRNIQSLLIEGGPTLFETLITRDLWDEARVFTGPAWFGTGIPAPHFPFQPTETGEIGNSRVMQFVRE
jgi:diaminohydroxyphosphoribosylaminopyrimidine deaminase/5-amino-6-(5-phosphoribosylamino)uracil reductase